MTRKKSGTKPADTNVLKVPAESGESCGETIARAVIDPTVTAAVVAHDYLAEAFGDRPWGDLCTAIRKETDRVQHDDLAGIESILTAQAIALNSMFTHLARKANKQERIPQFEIHMRMALRAQNQCRATLETLAKVKNPVIFAKQANIAHGPQQVNNTLNTCARETETTQTEQLEAPHAKPEWMDTGATRAPAPSHQDVEAVGAVNRAKNKGRQGKRKP